MSGCGDYNTEYDFGEEAPPPGEPDFAVTMNVSGEGVAYDLTWGMSPDATDGYDDGIDTYAPPAPPPPAFDAALGWMGDRYFKQIIASSMNAVSMDVLLQYPEDNVITITWDNSNWGEYFESVQLEDAFGGMMVSVDMLFLNRLELNDPAFNTLVINFTPSGGTVPSDNPFTNLSNAKGEIWAYGLRNPWRFSFDSLTGDLWVGDVGQNLYEEINLVTRGGNYGWNITEGFHCYDDSDGNCDQTGLEDPVVE